MLIDNELGTWERRVALARVVEAPPLATFDAIRRVDFLESPVVAVPNRARMLFDRVVRPGAADAAVPARFGFEQLVSEEGGFQLLAEEPGEELVLGFVGRWWERGYGRIDWTPEEFRELHRPGCGVGAWGFSVMPYGPGGSVLVTDVRVRCTDEEARRHFQRYWALVGPFVTAMGRPILRLVAREAERVDATAAA
ncbi:hypothetical protein [Oryzihumus sp.]|uniref:hypothetical protein n=1 Tax=Oryzihumus sp. TaxID=1968903 RepID=UPI002EDAC9B5